MSDDVAIRKCPIPFMHKGPGFCGWCGEPVEGAAWHPACRAAHQLHTNRDKQYAFLVARDGEKCGCGQDCDGKLEVEHNIPLWKIMHMPALERRWYFGPENLKLRAKRCHAIKSGRERSESAHYDALESTRLNGPKPKKGPRLQGRGFSNQARKLQGRPFQKRPKL